MKFGWAVVSLALCGCVDEPTPKDAETEAATIEKNTADKAILDQQLSIEKAADEAVKLIEADAKAEIDANVAASEN